MMLSICTLNTGRDKRLEYAAAECRSEARCGFGRYLAKWAMADPASNSGQRVAMYAEPARHVSPLGVPSSEDGRS